MSRSIGKQVGRRDFMSLAAGAAVTGSLGLVSRRARAGRKTLRIAKWPHFVPEYDVWFETVANDWGQRNDMLVSIDRIPIDKLDAAAVAEIRGGKGHDIFMFPSPPAQYYQHAIDHAGVYQAVAMNYGAIPQLAFRSTFYPRAKKYFAFSDFWMPAPLHFFQDRWAEVGMPLGPVSYTDLRAGGRKMRAQTGIPCGLAFSPTLEGNVTLHTMLYAFRAWVMDASGNALFDKNVFAVNALKYIQALYQESGDPQQLVWAPAGNVQAMLDHKTSATINAISLMRAAERQAPQLAGKIRLKPPLLGTNGMGVTALPHVTNCSVIWNFSHNQEAAVRFLAELVATSRTGYDKSLGCNFPIYPKTVPDLIVRLSKDPYADPGYKYVELKDALHWTPNLGVPGFATPAYMEVFNSSLIPKMVRSVLQGGHTPEDAAATTAREIQRVIAKWEEV
jgi:multiple sugar transport system substrate-binding protein